MPLRAQILRGGERVPLRWDDFHLAVLALASSFDDDTCTNTASDPAGVYETDLLRFDCYPDAAFPVTRELSYMLSDYGALSKTPMNAGVYTLRRKHRFLNLGNGEVITLYPGDVLHANR
jgi:hypothetical protein